MTNEELLVSGLRAVRKGDCESVLIAPDHTGEANYHNCIHRRLHKTGRHFCGCGYEWQTSGEVITQAVFDA